MQNFLSLLFFSGAITLPAVSFATTINFDSRSAPALFSSKTAQDVVTTSAVTIGGGVILNESKWQDAATTQRNLYATTDFLVAYLPAVITGVFSAPVGFLQLDVVNGLFDGSFTLTGFNGTGDVVDADTVPLAAFTHPGFVGHLSISASDITSFSVRSSQTLGLVNFSIDTINFTSVNSVPEGSGTLGLMGLALMSLVVLGNKKTYHPDSRV